MSTKRILIAVIVILVIAGGLYAWNEYNRTAPDLDDVQATVTIEAQSLLAEYMNDEAVANARYLEKIILVKGMVKNIVSVNNTYTIVLGDTTDMSSVRCLVDSTHSNEITGLQRGMMAGIKGAVTGFKKDETGLLGSDVELNRCVIQQ